MMESDEKDELCILCGEGKDKEALSQVGKIRNKGKPEGASNKLAYSFGQKMQFRRTIGSAREEQG